MNKELQQFVLNKLKEDYFAHNIEVNSKDWIVKGISFTVISQIKGEYFLKELHKKICDWNDKLNFNYIQVDTGVYKCLIYQKQKNEINTSTNNVNIKYIINKKIIDTETGDSETVKLNKYTGHQTTKYNNITAIDYFMIGGLRHTILSYTGKATRYVIREDGEIYSLNEKGEWKLKAQHFRESGGVKNRARREAGKSGGSVYKCVCLWSKFSFLTHKLVKDYVTHEKSANEYYSSNGTVDSIVKAGKHTHVGENFYRGSMPVDFGKRCYKA